jgi:hypothetical protein
MAWRNLDRYLVLLDAYPQAVADAAASIVTTHATAAFQAIHDGYPVVTGRLQRGLTLTDRSTDLHPRWTLRNDVVYAKIFETGGATTKGPKPHGHVFSRIAPIEVRAMRAELADLPVKKAPRV